jgi:hypothetical protein
MRRHGVPLWLLERTEPQAIYFAYQTLPIPAIKFAHGVESLFSNPAKAQSSRKGES